MDIAQVKKFFPKHRKCLVKVLLILVNCILQANSCNLNKAKKKGSIVLNKLTKAATLYTRFIRFFKMKGIEGFVIGIMQLVLSMALPYLGREPYYCLSIDRTNWKLGKLNINILYIGLVLSNGYFIPVFFMLLDKQGNSNQAERIDLMEGFKQVFTLFSDSLFVLVGDREFIGRTWFLYLLKSKYEFVLRLRKTDYLEAIAEQMGLSVEQLHKKIKRKVKSRGYCVLAPISQIERSPKTLCDNVLRCQKHQALLGLLILFALIVRLMISHFVRLCFRRVEEKRRNCLFRFPCYVF